MSEVDKSVHQRHINDLCVKRSVTLSSSHIHLNLARGGVGGNRLLTSRRVGSQRVLQELDSICHALGLPLLILFSLMARGVCVSALCWKEGIPIFFLYVFVCVRVRRARATVPVGPQGAVWCEVAHADAKFSSLDSLFLSSTSHQNPLVEARRQDCYLWDRHQADLRLSSLLPCGSHWKQMVSKQPVMFTAAAIKDKSPTTHSLRRPRGSHRALQTAA